ncbi:hypothetical protein [Actinomadura craniellae]|uniref:hypothetical protein n=1 Tax=Actinomadura craniellae TaxID=2231787 RepID=UPI0011BF3FC7|nr:hypothetical protein [Actinomadura craniellae]
MIILSGVLVVVAIALLVVGIVASNGESAQVFGLDALTLIYISISVSVVSALCLSFGVFLRRRELFGTGSAVASSTRKKKARAAQKKAVGKSAAKGKGAATPAEQGDAVPGDTLTLPSPSAEVPEDAIVYVVRGRKRYHIDSCRQLTGRDREELTYAEAKEEGFSPCTACLPDTALAARAAAGVAKPEPAKKGEKAEQAGKDAAKKPTAAAAAPLSAPQPPPAASEPPTAPASVLGAPSAPPAAPAPTREPDRLGTGSLAGDPPSAWSTPSTPATDPIAADPADRTPPEAGGKAAPVPPPQRPEPAASAPRAAERPRRLKSEPEEPGGEAPDPGPQVRILSGTKRYHRADCALIEDIGDEAEDLEALSQAEARARGCTPCLVCQPDKAHA